MARLIIKKIMLAIVITEIALVIVLQLILRSVTLIAGIPIVMFVIQSIALIVMELRNYSRIAIVLAPTIALLLAVLKQNATIAMRAGKIN